MVSNLELILRLLLSALVGGFIGMEREATNRPAGFRTHILVTLGSALIMLLSTQGFNGTADSSRLAAQVVSGIGFLGAGTIVRDGNNIQGLTTAASLWVCGGLGLAIGGGYYLGGLTTTAIVIISLTLFKKLEIIPMKKSYRTVTLKCRERAGLIGDIGKVFGDNNIIIKDLKINRDGVEFDKFLINPHEEAEYAIVELVFLLIFDKGFIYQDFNIDISEIQGVEEIQWKN